MIPRRYILQPKTPCEHRQEHEHAGSDQETCTRVVHAEPFQKIPQLTHAYQSEQNDAPCRGHQTIHHTHTHAHTIAQKPIYEEQKQSKPKNAQQAVVCALVHTSLLAPKPPRHRTQPNTVSTALPVGAKIVEIRGRSSQHGPEPAAGREPPTLSSSRSGLTRL